MPKLLIVDANNLYAVVYYSSKGNTSKVTDSFIGYLASICVEDAEATHLFVCWDSKDNQRKDKDSTYKSTRGTKPENYYDAFPSLIKRLEEEKVQQYQSLGHEADDIIAKLVKAARKKNYKCTIVSGDKDMYFLLSDDENNQDVRIYNPQKSIWVDTTSFIQKYQIKPSQFQYVKALFGDSSDNISGVNGVGEKTALEAIRCYGSLDSLYNSDFSNINKRFREKVKVGKEAAYKSLQQVQFIEDFDLPKQTCAVMPEIFRPYD